MKSNSKLILGVLGFSALLWVGCEKTQYPSSYLTATGPNPAMVINFESGLQVSSNLAEANRPGNLIQTPGLIAATGSPSVTPLIASPGANGTADCVHMVGSVTDPGNASYPAILLLIPIETAGSGHYDASLFSGIKFYIKVAASDTASTRVFSIPIVKTSVAPAGTCATYNTCYNNFAFTYPNTGGAWVLETIPFTSMTRGNYGGSFTPSTLSGANLQEILSLQWSEGNQNVPATVNVDFAVDEVQFF